MKIKIKKFGTKIVVGTLIGLIFMSAIASRQGYVATAEPMMTCNEGFKISADGLSCEPAEQGSAAKAKESKPAAQPAIVCQSPFGPSADGFSCEAAIGDDGKLAGEVVAACPDEFIKAPSTTAETLVCSKVSGKSMANSEDLVKRMQALIWVQGALNRLIWPVLVLIGGLMDNDLLFGNGMEERLREIWIPIRNLVNILFVLLLVGIALYNVLGIGGEGEGSSLKSVLPKIIIGIIAINFSFLAIKVFLDAVNVMTTSVFSLPGQVSEGLALIDAGGKDKKTIEKLCQSFSGMSSQDFKSMTDEQMIAKDDTQIYKDAFNKVKSKYPEAMITTTITSSATIQDIQAKIDSISALNPSLAIKTEFKKEVKAQKSGMICIGSELSTQGKIFLKRFNSSNAAFAMALLLGKIVYYQDLKASDFSNIEKVAFNALFSMIFYLVYAASFVALLIVLLARLVIMWISIALSPVLILALASSTVKEKLGGFSKLTEQFTKMAIAPLIIAITMAIGWIMLRAIQSINMFDSGSSLTLNVSNGIPVVGLSTIQDLVVACGTIAIVWLGVFGAAEGTIAEKLTGTMKDWLQTAGKWVGALPFRHIPFVPISIPGKNGGEPQHFTGAQVTQALSDVFHEGSKPQRELSKMLGIGSDGEEDLEDVGTKGELYKHLDLKSVNDMASEGYRKELEIWTKDHDKEYESIKGKDEVLYNHIKSLIELKGEENEKEREEIAGKIKKRPLIKGASQRSGDSETATAQPLATDGYKPVTPDSKIGGRKISDTLPAVADSAPAITAYDGHGSKLNDDIGGLMKSNPDGKRLKDEVKKLTNALKELRINGIAPTEPELRQQISDEKVEYLKKALGDGDPAKGKVALETALGRPPAQAGGTGGTTTPPADEPPAAQAAGAP